MRYELHVSAYDVLDHIVWSCRLRHGNGSLEDPYEWLDLRSGRIQGVGADEPYHWASEVLMGVIESL